MTGFQIPPVLKSIFEQPYDESEKDHVVKAPTGTGKSVGYLILSVLKALFKEKGKAIFVTPQIEIAKGLFTFISQTTLDSDILHCFKEWAGVEEEIPDTLPLGEFIGLHANGDIRNPDAQVFICSPGSALNRFQMMKSQIRTVVLDEADILPDFITVLQRFSTENGIQVIEASATPRTAPTFECEECLPFERRITVTKVGDGKMCWSLIDGTISDWNKKLVVVPTVEQVHFIRRALDRKGYNVICVTSQTKSSTDDLTKKYRQSGEPYVIVATIGSVSRGVTFDIEDIVVAVDKECIVSSSFGKCSEASFPHLSSPTLIQLLGRIGRIRNGQMHIFSGIAPTGAYTVDGLLDYYSTSCHIVDKCIIYDMLLLLITPVFNDYRHVFLTENSSTLEEMVECGLVGADLQITEKGRFISRFHAMMSIEAALLLYETNSGVMGYLLTDGFDARGKFKDALAYAVIIQLHKEGIFSRKVFSEYCDSIDETDLTPGNEFQIWGKIIQGFNSKAIEVVANDSEKSILSKIKEVSSRLKWTIADIKPIPLPDYFEVERITPENPSDGVIVKTTFGISNSVPPAPVKPVQGGGYRSHQRGGSAPRYERFGGRSGGSDNGGSWRKPL